MHEWIQIGIVAANALGALVLVFVRSVVVHFIHSVEARLHANEAAINALSLDFARLRGQLEGAPTSRDILARPAGGHRHSTE